MNGIRWLRILASGFLAELAIFAVFLPATLLLGEKPGMYTAVVGSLIMPFLFAVWATRHVQSRHVLQGTLVGAVGIVIYIALTQGQPEPWPYIFAHFLKLVGGGLGGYMVLMRKPDPIPTP